MSDSNATLTESDKTIQTIQIGDGNSTREKRASSNRSKDKSKSLSSKVVIRRLPPSMDEETFLKQIDPVPEYDYFYFVSADWSLGQNASSRAYINFVHDEDIFIFKDRFDGYVFVETKGGVEYPAIVEFAPFQGLPKSKSRKKDNKCNTLETDPHYIQFMALLNGETSDVKSEMKMEYSYQIKDEKKITSTPLLEYIANKKLERREERKKKIDERKRQRDEERNRKKNQVVKAIPSSIQEQDEDGIIVRVIKSRPRDRGDRFKRDRPSESSTKQTASDSKSNKPESSRDDKRKLEREQRENKRREERQRFKEERDQKRQADRERYRKEREMNRKEETKADKSSVKTEADGSNKPNQKEDKVRRYSESRRARFENKERNDISNKPIDGSDKCTKISQNETNEKVQEDVVLDKRDEAKDSTNEPSGETSIKKEFEEEKLNPTEDIKNNDDSSGDNAKDSSSKSLSKEERLARRIRNKDRPSLQIYQPGQGKRRMSTKKEDEKSADDTSPKIGSKPSSPTSSEISVTFPTDKSTHPSTNDSSFKKPFRKEKSANVDRTTKNNEKGRVDKANETTKSQSNKQGQTGGRNLQSQDFDSASVDRKVSRYSERRNKMKEKQNMKLENVDGAVEVEQKNVQSVAADVQSVATDVQSSETVTSEI